MGLPQIDGRRIRRSVGPASLCLLCLSVLVQAAPAEEQTASLLRAGTWSGFYQPRDSDRVEATFVVEAAEDEPSGWRLEVRLVLEPRDRFVFAADSLKVESDSIKFRFGRPGDQRDCELRREEDAELTGSCRGTDDSERVSFARILMKPPREMVKSESNAAAVAPD